jgi:transcriptional regulator with XRE-family HTH domain
MAKKAPAGFTDEERRLRMRMIDMGIRQRNIADELGIHINDVSNVIRGRSRSPRYVAEVYKFLGLEQDTA